MAAKRGPRKLLVASIGVATINYMVGTGCSSERSSTSGNLPAPPAGGSAGASGAGGLAGGTAAGSGGGGSGGTPPTVANLPAPPPMLTGGRGSSD